MPKDPVVQIGAPVLRQRALPVAKKDIGSPKMRALLRRMSATLKKEGFGVAIAAPQVGEPLRIFVISGKVFAEPDEKETPPDKVFINPEISRLSKATREMSEGCLSVRGKYGTVIRHEKASIRATDGQGKLFSINGAGLVAHIFQHEMDHLEGILYVDKAVKLEDDDKREELKANHPA